MKLILHKRISKNTKEQSEHWNAVPVETRKKKKHEKNLEKKWKCKQNRNVNITDVETQFLYDTIKILQVNESLK